ncbi:galactokinase [Frankia sp. AgB1.9]|uniref:galactokinase n=1 Tax=unclassified Frankia TaxID=2632575 RepID=UPI0019329D37|nr:MULTISPECIES: galactokinase family protein [unclassified Frankia]MBL7487931.1 galactokinase [Frankia sp. AgW1.1]MBL7549997.1 galactokinase [Frankia sp. AgB1.9]MBL7621425.1 galactokinase [Frankia sp. AgB1.8]
MTDGAATRGVTAAARSGRGGGGPRPARGRPEDAAEPAAGPDGDADRASGGARRARMRRRAAPVATRAGRGGPVSAAAFGPGRVNLVGEHTDYNDGLCLPFAIELGVTVRARPAPDGLIRVHAVDIGAHDVFAADAPARADGWRSFARGVVAELAAAGYPVRPARLSVAGTLPRGAGMSSLAALEVALVLALLAHSGYGEPDRLELAQLLSRVENTWVGARTGLLDQTASLFGRPGHALRLDIRALTAGGEGAPSPVAEPAGPGARAGRAVPRPPGRWLSGPAGRPVPGIEPVRLDLGRWRLVTVDSGVRHAIAASGYNTRREECARACELLGISSLRDADEDAPDRLPEPLGRRVRHVLEENERVRRAVVALRAGDLPELGRLLDASHASLRDLYEVSVPAVEETVARLAADGAAGARLVGGGFGGSVLALFPPGKRPPAEALRVVPGGPGRLVRR